MEHRAPTADDLVEAHSRIAPYIHRTPIYTSELLDASNQAELFFKCENLQKVGAFKARGATNAVLALDEEAANRGVATHSSGNHGAAQPSPARHRGYQMSEYSHLLQPARL